jgi:hypothetical protein
MNTPKLFPGFPKGDRGVIKMGVMKTAESFSRGSARSKQLSTIMSVLADALSDESLYQEIFKKIHPDYQELSNWWNKEMFQKRGGQMGTGQLMAIEVDKDREAEEATQGMDPEGMHFLQSQLMASKAGGPITMMLGRDPERAEEIAIFHEILWIVFISIFKQGGLDKLSSIFRKNSGRNWA